MLPQHLPARRQVAGHLALRSAADQFAADEGVTADPSYARRGGAGRAGPRRPARRRSGRPSSTSRVPTTYVQAVEQVGRREARRGRGRGGHRSPPGRRPSQQWLDDHDIADRPAVQRVDRRRLRGAVRHQPLLPARRRRRRRRNADQPDTEYAAALPGAPALRLTHGG